MKQTNSLTQMPALRKALSAAFTCAILLAGMPAFADDSAAAKTNDAAEAKYTIIIERRAADILKALKLDDKDKAARVHDALIAHYRGLNAWQAAHETEVKALRKKADPVSMGKVDVFEAERRAMREKLLGVLNTNLSPEQVTLVKDKLTYNKVNVTYNAYCSQHPGLNEAQKTSIMEWLIQAREEAIDGCSAEEKTAIFQKYKGKINNYLSKNGFPPLKPKLNAE